MHVKPGHISTANVSCLHAGNDCRSSLCDEHDFLCLWLQVVIGMGLLAAVGYAVKQFVAPKVYQWVQEWRHDADRARAEEEQQKTAQLVASAIQSQVNSLLTFPVEASEKDVQQNQMGLWATGMM